jgi:hypothetical protein
MTGGPTSASTGSPLGRRSFIPGTPRFVRFISLFADTTTSAPAHRRVVAVHCLTLAPGPFRARDFARCAHGLRHRHGQSNPQGNATAGPPRPPVLGGDKDLLVPEEREQRRMHEHPRRHQKHGSDLNGE